MKIELEVTFSLSPALLALLPGLLSVAERAASPLVIAGPTNDSSKDAPAPAAAAADAAAAAPAAPPVKRGPGRPRKVDAQQAPILAGPIPAPAAEPVAPAPAVTAPNVELSAIAKMLQATVKKVGVPPVRELLAEFGIDMLPKLKPEQFEPFAQALQELNTMAGG